MAPRRVNEGPRVVGLGDLGHGSADESDDERMTYYAGGEKSGVAVEGGGDARADAQRLIVRGAPARAEAPAGGFTGRGRRIGDDAPVQSEGSGQAARGEDLPAATHRMTLWANGFTVDNDRRLRSWDAPGSREVIEALHAGNAPPGLFDVRPGQAVDLHVQNRMAEPYDERPSGAPAASFSGASHRLGDEPVRNAPALSPPPASGAQPASLPGAEGARGSVQLRMPNGARQTVRGHASNTLGELRSYVQSVCGRSVRLLAGRPPSVLPASADTETLSSAHLLNAAVIVEFE